MKERACSVARRVYLQYVAFRGGSVTYCKWMWHIAQEWVSVYDMLQTSFLDVLQKNETYCKWMRRIANESDVLQMNETYCKWMRQCPWYTANEFFRHIADEWDTLQINVPCHTAHEFPRHVANELDILQINESMSLTHGKRVSLKCCKWMLACVVGQWVTWCIYIRIYLCIHTYIYIYIYICICIYEYIDI